MDELEALQARRRKRRRQRRAGAVAGFILLATGLAWFFESQATSTIIVVRHAEVLANGSSDPGLSPRGNVRAQELARVLGDVDVVAGIDAIYVAPNRASRDTSAPIAKLNQAPVLTIEDPAAVEDIVRGILQRYKGKIVLLVTDAEYMQPVIAEMQGSKKLPSVGQGDEENIYVVSIPWFGKVKTLRIKYGQRYVPPAR